MEIAKAAGFDGIEIMLPRRVESWELFNNDLCHPVLHASFWTDQGHKDRLTRKTGNKVEMALWEQLLGPAEHAITQAQLLELPVVVHPRVILELHAQKKLSMLEQIADLRIENDDEEGYWVPEAVFAYGLASEVNSKVSLALDFEHVAKEYRWQPGKNGHTNFLQLLESSFQLIGRRQVREIHVCDYHPSSQKIKGGGHLPLGQGSLPLQEAIALVKRYVSGPLDIVLEAAPDFFARSIGLGINAAKAEATAALQILRS